MILFQRLSLNTVARFRCVSKLWSSITTDPYFIKSFKTRSPRPSLLICLRKKDEFIVSSISQHTHTLHQNSNKGYTRFPFTESVQGLICFQELETLEIWNPSKRQFLTLPKSRKSWDDLTVLLGYDPVQGKHKVVAWRCIKGVIYYIACVYHTRVWVIMSFNVRSETFDMIQLPSGIHKDMLITNEGRLACTGKNRELWILEDAEKHKWSIQGSLSPFDQFNEFHKSFYILFFDLVRNSCRRLEFKAFADDESWLNGDMHELHAFPNHIESQMSLNTF
ncbi:hypothetical protein EUTSA_v10012114mg, partial [Eutrema salsugineum]